MPHYPLHHCTHNRVFVFVVGFEFVVPQLVPGAFGVAQSSFGLCARAKKSKIDISVLKIIQYKHEEDKILGIRSADAKPTDPLQKEK